MDLLRWSGAPPDATQTQKRNFLRAHADAIGVGLTSATGAFLPVFLTRLGATNFQVGLLTAMPGVAGLVLALLVGRVLQGRRSVVPWFSAARLANASVVALTGLVPFLVPLASVVPAVLAIRGVATVPMIVNNVSFSVLMSGVGGPKGRYALMSRRWSILGMMTAVTVAIAGYVLDRTAFPRNYQLVFIVLSLGGLISFFASRRIVLPDSQGPRSQTSHLSAWQRLKDSVALVRQERAFVSVATKRFVYYMGSFLILPLLPLYYVREAQASDAWIGIITTVQTAVALVGYYLWAHLSNRRGARFTLLCTTAGLALHPALIAFTRHVELIALYAIIGGVFGAGLNLVFFDELMKTVPSEYSPTFVAVALLLQYVATVAAPLIGTALADRVGLSAALLVGAALRLAGFALFAASKQSKRAVPA